MTASIITVKEWFFDKLNDTMKGYRCMVSGCYTNDRLDHTKLKVSEVLSETEKAYQVVVDAETFGGSYKAWKTWIPKSVVEG